MIAIIDYGMGNLRSVQKALERSGKKCLITQDPALLREALKIVLPGVGAMQPAMEKLTQLNLTSPIKDAIQQGKPFLGICLGMQLLFEKSTEGGNVPGLGIFKGTVERFSKLKVPHMGWNQIQFKKANCPLLKGIEDSASVYFCHSYFAVPEDSGLISTTTDYGVTFASSLWKNNVFAVQFHPEKSQSVGLRLLNNFAKL